MIVRLLNLNVTPSVASRQWLEPGLPVCVGRGATVVFHIDRTDGEPQPCLRASQVGRPERFQAPAPNLLNLYCLGLPLLAVPKALEVTECPGRVYHGRILVDFIFGAEAAKTALGF